MASVNPRLPLAPLATRASLSPSPIEQTLTALRTWATDSIQYVKRRNHLTIRQKQQVYQLLTEYISMLGYKADSLSLLPDLKATQEALLANQAKVNRFAELYEFPPFPLPDGVPPAAKQHSFLFKALDNALAPVIWKGDELYCKLVEPAAYGSMPEGKLIFVEHRPQGMRKPSVNKVGLFGGIDQTATARLTLRFEHLHLKQARPDWQVAMRSVVRLYRVESVSRYPELMA